MTATRMKPRRAPRRRAVTHRWPIALVALAGLLALAVGLVALTWTGSPPRGTIAAGRTTHDFGQAPINGGLLVARFPLTIESDALVTDLGTTWMCTRARLVQATTSSDWFGMPHRVNPNPAVNMLLTAGQPAYLEVTVDPAAHGDAGLGPIQRGVTLRAASGQDLLFTLTAMVTR